MKNVFTATGLAVAALSMVSSAHAAPVYQHLAGITQARNGAQEALLSRENGVSNTSTTATVTVLVTPPRMRLEEGATGVTVRIGLNKSAAAPAFRCVVELRNQSGAVVESETTSAVPANVIAGNTFLAVTFSNSEVGGGYRTVTVTCPLPPNRAIRLTDVRAI